MKILMTADAVGGAWSYSAELARGLSLAEIQAAIVTMGPRPSDSQRAEINGIRGALLCESDFKLEWMDDPWDDVDAAGEWLLGLEGVLRPDVIHLNGYAHGNLPWRAPVLMVAHSCVLSWWEAVKHEPAPMRRWGTYYDRVRSGIHAADYLVAPTVTMLDSVKRLYGRTEAMCAVANGRDPAQFDATAEKENFVAACGRFWDEAKNIAAVERAAAQIEWPIYLAGNRVAPNGQTAALNSPSCHALGQLDTRAFAEFLARAAIFCSPSCYEPFGLCALEAALSGCALVLGDIPSLHELWDDAAMFVAPADDCQIVEVLSELINAPAKRTQLAAKARQRALRFGADGMANDYARLYESLLAESYSFLEGKRTACVS